MSQPLNYAIIGLGARGSSLLKNVLLPMAKDLDQLRVVAVCDLYADRAKQASATVAEAGFPAPLCTCDYKEVLARGDLDAVIVSSAWESHVEIAVAAMKAGIPVGLEVGGAYDINDCWRLVDTAEETGVSCMLLENCCYGKKELMTLNMARQGVFGQLVHCEGGYHHDLREEISCGNENRHYRLRNYTYRNCENYPTHELGPLAKLLDLNNGNRLLTLTSTASCAKGLHEYILQHRPADDPLTQVEFAQGDVVTTVLKTSRGQTITLVLDTTLPRAYSRGYTVRGTKGAYFEDTNSIFLDGEHNAYEFKAHALWDNAKEYEAQYLHPLWQNYDPKGGHGGMDWLVFQAFHEALVKGVRPPIDVYDAALYMSITALSEQSIAQNGAPMAVPDFTRGKWHMRRDLVPLDFGLDRIPE